jgi:hypothetical protein
MVAVGLIAANAEEFPEARLFVRGFAAHQVAVAAIGLGSLSRPGLRRPAMLLAATIDAADIISAVIDARARGFDRTPSGVVRPFSSPKRIA